MKTSYGIGDRYLTTGHERDQKKGLDYRGARYYDSDIARFLSTDPWAKRYPEWSTYNYVIANPLRFTDPTGKGSGDLFSSPDEAAEDFGKNYNDNSIVLRKEIASSIVKITVDGKTFYTYIQPSVGTEATSTPTSRPDMSTVARIHTHGNYSPMYKNNVFSDTDMKNANLKKVNSYVVTPNGNLRKYNYKTKKVTVIASDMPSDPKDPERKNKVSPYGTSKSEPLYGKWEYIKHWILNPMGDALQGISDSKNSTTK